MDNDELALLSSLLPLFRFRFTALLVRISSEQPWMLELPVDSDGGGTEVGSSADAEIVGGCGRTIPRLERDIGLFERESKVHEVSLASGPTNTSSTFLRSLTWFLAEAHSGALQLVQSKLGEFERLGIASITSRLPAAIFLNLLVTRDTRCVEKDQKSPRVFSSISSASFLENIVGPATFRNPSAMA